MTIVDIVLLVAALLGILFGASQGLTGMISLAVSILLCAASLMYLDSLMLWLEPYVPHLQWRLIATLSVLFFLVGIVSYTLRRSFVGMVRVLHLGLLDTVLGAAIGFSISVIMTLSGLYFIFYMQFLSWDLWYTAMVYPYASVLIQDIQQFYPVFEPNGVFATQ